jgi:hypothetical protein
VAVTARETKKLVALMRDSMPVIKAMMPMIRKMAVEAEKMADEIESSQLVESWPVYNDGDYIMCGKEECACEHEDSVILIPFVDLTYPPFPPYTMSQLYAAIRDHIEQQRYRDEEKED